MAGKLQRETWEMGSPELLGASANPECVTRAGLPSLIGGFTSTAL